MILAAMSGDDTVVPYIGTWIETQTDYVWETKNESYLI